jgi:hypothetical protein
MIDFDSENILIPLRWVNERGLDKAGEYSRILKGSDRCSQSSRCPLDQKKSGFRLSLLTCCCFILSGTCLGEIFNNRFLSGNQIRLSHKCPISQIYFCSIRHDETRRHLSDSDRVFGQKQIKALSF